MNCPGIVSLARSSHAVLSDNFVTTPIRDDTLNYTKPWLGFYNDFNRYVDENNIKYAYSADYPA